MVRQAHTYLVGAMSGATLIAVAIAVFVFLVSAQVFRDWPISGLGGSEGSVSKAQPATDSSAAAAASGAAAAGGAAANGAAGQGSNVTRNGSGGLGAPQSGAVQGTQTGSGGGNSVPPQGQAGGGGGSNGAAGGGGSAGGNGSGAGSGSSTAGQVTGTVNDTVHGVDQTVTGGALEDSGVTKVTEGVVEGVAGPKSPVGKVVDETAGAVGGLLDPGR
jgi:hypothetical protein